MCLLPYSTLGYVDQRVVCALMLRVGCAAKQSDLDNAIEALRLQIVDVAREHGRMIASQVGPSSSSPGPSLSVHTLE